MAGERNSSLTPVHTLGPHQMEGKPANLWDSVDGFIPHIVLEFVSPTSFLSGNSWRSHTILQA